MFGVPLVGPAWIAWACLDAHQELSSDAKSLISVKTAAVNVSFASRFKVSPLLAVKPRPLAT
jgi:hypothetical protein